MRALALIACLALGLVAAVAPTPVRAQQALVRVLHETFSQGLDAWDEQRLDRRSTVYRLETLDGDVVLKAASNDAAAALVRRLPSGPVAGGRLGWRWRVMHSLTENAHETERRGDDYVARLFVLFGDGTLERGTRALAYVWAGRQPVGSVYPNSYFADVATWVLQSGDRLAGDWVTEERDLTADYERAFGEPAPDVAGIAILVDTDDTGGAAMAWFDDLELWALPADPSEEG